MVYATLCLPSPDSIHQPSHPTLRSVSFLSFFLSFCVCLDALCFATTQSSFTKLIFSWVYDEIDGLVSFSVFHCLVA